MTSYLKMTSFSGFKIASSVFLATFFEARDKISIKIDIDNVKNLKNRFSFKSDQFVTSLGRHISR